MVSFIKESRNCLSREGAKPTGALSASQWSCVSLASESGMTEAPKEGEDLTGRVT